MLHKKTLQIKACKVFSCSFFSQLQYADPAQQSVGNSSRVFFCPVRPRNRLPNKNAHFLVRAAVSPLWAGFRPLTQESATELAFQIPDRFSGCFRILNLRPCAGTDISTDIDHEYLVCHADLCLMHGGGHFGLRTLPCQRCSPSVHTDENPELQQ